MRRIVLSLTCYVPTGSNRFVRQISTDKRPAGQKIEDRITLFAAALEAASDGEEQTQTSREDDP